MPHPRIALNPIQWIATRDGWVDPALSPPPTALLAEVAATGFTAIMADLPKGWSVGDYLSALADHGLEPAPGYLSLALPEEGMTPAEALDLARRAAATHAELGLGDMFLATRMRRDAARVRRPAIGADFDPDRFDRVLDLIERAAAAMIAEGIRPALHPHIGTWIETEAETRAVLDRIGAAQLGFGPDTGHLSWTGADVIGLIGDYRDRIRAAHIKDCRLSRRRAAIAAGLDYQATVLSGIWAEPGSGELDLPAMIAAMGADFDGWLIAEVDFTPLPAADSARACLDWFRARA